VPLAIREARAQHGAERSPAEHEPLPPEQVVQHPLRISRELGVGQEIVIGSNRVEHRDE
jgi:hypothetical protein